MKNGAKRLVQNTVFLLLSLGLILLFWFVLSKIVDSELLLPGIPSAAKSLGALVQRESFWIAVGNSVWRAVRSFLYAVAAAGVLSVLAYRFTVLERLFGPVVTVLRAVPTMSVILLSLIWLDNGKAPMLIAFLITFPMLYSVFLTALKGVPKDLSDMSRSYLVSGKDRLFSLYLPAVLPSGLAGMQSTVSLNLKIIIASEVMAQTRKSMGIYMQRAMVYFDTAELLAWTVAAIVFSYLLELVVLLVKKLVVRWKQ